MGGGGDLAGYWPRAAAWLLDLLVIVAMVVVLLFIAGGAGASNDSAGSVVIIGALLGNVLYAPVLMCRKGERNGQTLGKQALGIRVVREDAEPIGVPVAFMREFVGKSLLGSVFPYPVVDYLWPVWDRRSQAVHDKIASTFVVRADAVPDLDHRAGRPLAPGAPSGWASPTSAAPEGWAPPSSATPPAERAPADMSAWARPPAPAEPGAERAPEPDAAREPEPPAPVGDTGFAPPAPPPPPDPEDDEPVRGPFGPS